MLANFKNITNCKMKHEANETVTQQHNKIHLSQQAKTKSITDQNSKKNPFNIDWQRSLT